METQTTNTDWLAAEEETFKQTEDKNYEKLPTLKLVQNEIVEFTIDFSKPFFKWHDEDNDTFKAVIPITHNAEKKNWWLNVKNPIYPSIIRAGRTGQTLFKILQIGTANKTEYKLVK